MNSNKTLLFPGWMSRVKNYQLGDGVEIWQKPVDPNTYFDSEYMIGHSLGANFALLNWQANKNSKLILISPIVLKKSLLGWFFHWLGYVIGEGLVIPLDDFKSNKFFFGFKAGLKLLRQDFLKLIIEIPKENVTIVRGKNDNYLCDKVAAEFFIRENIRLVEIEGSGHNWSVKIKEEVLKIINNEKN